MEAKELKDKIQEYLNKADERVLKIVNSVFDNYHEDETVAFNPDGSPVSK